jgi:hypothetical protein
MNPDCQFGRQRGKPAELSRGISVFDYDRAEPGRVEKLGSLQVVESAPERLVWELGDRLEERERYVLVQP